jgi:hypothetical protein
MIVRLMLAAGVAALPFFVYLLVVSLAALRARRAKPLPRETGPRFLIAIPAHEEETGTRRTLRSWLNVNYPVHPFEVVVIADNRGEKGTSLITRVQFAQLAMSWSSAMF